MQAKTTSADRCAKCSATHKRDVPCASPMCAVRTPFPTPDEVRAWENFCADLNLYADHEA